MHELTYVESKKTKELKETESNGGCQRNVGGWGKHV